jgi:uncharacterized protein (DUF2062 family)
VSETAPRARGWLARLVPTREAIAANRWMRPFAGNVLRPDLWRFTRRSVPRGVALGLFIGVIVPMAHFVIAAVLAVVVRANVPAALAATFIGNPLTVAGLWWVGYRIGETVLHADALTHVAPVAATMQVTQTDQFLAHLTGAGEDTALGLLVIAVVCSALGYLVSAWLWRLRVMRKRRERVLQAGAA